MAEFDLIAQVFRPLAGDPGAQGLGDDGACLPRLPTGQEWRITTDTLVEGVHFRATDPLDAVAWRALATNVSDLVAQAAQPRAYFLNLALGKGFDGALFGGGLAQAQAAFGLSLATCNVNGDASPDLIVGAPFFDDEKSQHQRGGAVYLFVSKNGQLSQKRRIKIVGKELLGQFGLSLTCMGDMNSDGYEDFAVGAPYEENGGSVYIFFGQGRYTTSAVLRAEKVAVQTITPQSFKQMPTGSPLTTFGSSLSGGLDMDANG